ncbi:MAG: hypothetical protein QXP31_06225 [Pyrobaculum sp.]
MKFLILLAAPLAFSIALAPGIDVAVTNKTTLTVLTDLVVKISVNNTLLSLHYRQDVYTIAVVNLQFNCGVRGGKTMHYIFQNPHSEVSLSLSQLTSDICLGEETRAEALNATFLVLTRGGRLLDSYYADLTQIVKDMAYVPEWRVVAFNVKTEVVDRCNWVQTRLQAKYGGDIGVVKITSWDCFNQSKALRVAYQPYAHYLTKYIKVKLTLTVANATVEKDLSNGGEYVVPEDAVLYGKVNYFKIEITGPQNYYVIHPLNYTGPITITPLTVVQKNLTAVVAAIRQLPTGLEVDLLLNDTVGSDGLKITAPPGQLVFARVERPTLLKLLIMTETGEAGGNFTIEYQGPGVVKRGVAAIPPAYAVPAALVKQFPLVAPRYYPVQLRQPQLLIALSIPRLAGQVAAYVEANVTIRPRDPHKPTTLISAAYFNKSGVLTPVPYLVNASNSGRLSAYVNGTVTLRYLIPAPDGDYDYLVLFIYGDNVADYRVERGYAYVLTGPATPQLSSATASTAGLAASAAALALLSLYLARRYA